MGEGHVGLVEHVSFLRDSLDADTKYSHRQVFGTLPRNVDEEDLVDPQASSINLLKAQRARKAANAATTHHRTRRSSTPEAADLPQPPPPEGSTTPALPTWSELEDQFGNFEDDLELEIEEEQLQPSSPGLHSRVTANGGPEQVLPRRRPATPFHRDTPESTPQRPHHFSSLTNRLHQVPLSETRPPLHPVQPSARKSNPKQSSQHHSKSSPVRHQGLGRQPPPSQKRVPQPQSSPVRPHSGRHSQAKVLPSTSTHRVVRAARTVGMWNALMTHIFQVYLVLLDSLDSASHHFSFRFNFVVLSLLCNFFFCSVSTRNFLLPVSRSPILISLIISNTSSS